MWVGLNSGYPMEFTSGNAGGERHRGRGACRQDPDEPSEALEKERENNNKIIIPCREKTRAHNTKEDEKIIQTSDKSIDGRPSPVCGGRVGEDVPLLITSY